MAYIVEMQYGNSNKLEIMGMDARGDLYVEKIIITGEADPNFRQFKCSGDNWKKALELGEKLGWVPAGTIYEETLELDEKVYSNYDPPSVVLGEDYKVFTAEDAFNFAIALEKAIDLMQNFDLKEYGSASTILFRSGMNKAEYENINRNMNISFLQDFVAFLKKGEFFFRWDD